MPCQCHTMLGSNTPCSQEGEVVRHIDLDGGSIFFIAGAGIPAPGSSLSIGGGGGALFAPSPEKYLLNSPGSSNGLGPNILTRSSLTSISFWSNSSATAWT